MARNKEAPPSPDFDDERSSRRHHDDDVPHPDDMPPDGTEADAGSSVMDDVPEEPAPKKVRVARGKKGGITVKFDAPAAGNTADTSSSAPPRVSPADPSDEIQSMVDVDGVRPNLPKAIRGTLTLTREGVNFPTCADGVTPAMIGWAGEIPDSPKYREDAIEKFGGGRYVVSGIGKDGKPKSFYLDLAGYSKPIPGTPAAVPQTLPGGEYPNFSMPGVQEQPGIPVGNGVYQDPNTGEFIAGGDDPSTVEEWVWSTQRNMWVWTGRGRPPGRPPQGGPPNQQPAFNPSAYGADDDRIAKLEALVKDVAQGGGMSSMDRYLQMQQAQAEKEDARRREDREREREEKKEERERERDIQDRLREERKEEREREREEKKEEREREREDRKAAAAAQAEAVKAQAQAMKEIATIQATTASDNAKASVEAAREMAKMQAEASKTVMDIVLKKGNEGGLGALLDQHVKIKNLFGGGESDKSEAERIMGMIPQLVDSVGPQLVNGVNAIRGKAGFGGGAPSGGDAGSGAVFDDDKIISAVDVVVKCRQNNYPPDVAVRHLATSCIALEMDLNKVKGLILMTEQAPPAMIAANLDKAMQGRPEPAQKKIAGVKELLSNPAHAEWLKAFIYFLKGGQPAPTPAALPGAQAPAPAKPPAGAAPPAAPPAQPPAPPAGPRNGY